MLAYVGLTVRIHGLARSGKEWTMEEVRARVYDVLRNAFHPDLDGDIEVEIDESAG